MRFISIFTIYIYSITYRLHLRTIPFKFTSWIEISLSIEAV